MTCEQFREEIELLINETELSASLCAHLEACAECRLFSNRLRSLEALLADESAFRLAPSEQNAMLAEIDAKTAWAPRTRIVSLRWTRYAAVAAVVALSFIGVTGYMRGWFRSGDSNGSSFTALSDSGSDTSAASVDLLDNLLTTSTDTGGDLLLEPSSTTLDSVTADELNYLQKNFRVEDVL